MDGECNRILNLLKIPDVKVISLDEVISKEILWIYEEMTFGQICWTSQPLLCKYVLKHFKVDHVVYLEADSYFFSNPGILFEEIGHKSVSLVPHNYARQYDSTNTSGIYCVQFNYFLNNVIGNYFLELWMHECFRYNKKRTGYYPGQLCMNQWPAISDEVCVIRNIGAGVAPWNSISFKVDYSIGVPTVNNEPIVFFHFHELAYLSGSKMILTSYALSKETKQFIYANYLKNLFANDDLIRACSGLLNLNKYLAPPEFKFGNALLNSKYYRGLIRYLIILYRGRKNIINIRNFINELK